MRAMHNTYGAQQEECTPNCSFQNTFSRFRFAIFVIDAYVNSEPARHTALCDERLVEEQQKLNSLYETNTVIVSRLH